MKKKKFLLILLCAVLILQIFGAAYTVVLFGYWIGPFKSVAIDKIVSEYDPSTRTGEIIFYGASNFRLWETMDEDMAPYVVQNHGMGGCNDAELLEYAEQVLYPYQPRAVFIQTGSNDNTQGLSLEEIKSNKEKLYGTFRENLPDTVFIIMSGLPCPNRSEYWDDINTTNQFIAQYCDEHEDFYFIDAIGVMTTENGDFRPELFNNDGIHLNDAGHAVWTELMLSKLDEIEVEP